MIFGSYYALPYRFVYRDLFDLYRRMPNPAEWGNTSFKSIQMLYDRGVPLPELTDNPVVVSRFTNESTFSDLLQPDIFSEVACVKSVPENTAFNCTLIVTHNLQYIAQTQSQGPMVNTRRFLDKLLCLFVEHKRRLPDSVINKCTRYIEDQLDTLFQKTQHPLRPDISQFTDTFMGRHTDNLEGIHDIALRCYLLHLQARTTLKRECDVARWTIELAKDYLWSLAPQQYEEEIKAIGAMPTRTETQRLAQEAAQEQHEIDQFECWQRLAYEFVAFGQSVFWLWMTDYVTGTLANWFPSLMKLLSEDIFSKWNGMTAVKTKDLSRNLFTDENISAFVVKHANLTAQHSSTSDKEIMVKIIGSVIRGDHTGLEKITPGQTWSLRLQDLPLVAGYQCELEHVGWLNNQQLAEYTQQLLVDFVLVPTVLYVHQTCFDYGSIIQYASPSVSSGSLNICRYEQLAVDTPLARTEQNLAEMLRLAKGILNTRIDDESGKIAGMNEAMALACIIHDFEASMLQKSMPYSTKVFLMSLYHLIPLDQLQASPVPILDKLMALPHHPDFFVATPATSLVDLQIAEGFIEFATMGGYDLEDEYYQQRITELGDIAFKDTRRVPNLQTGFNRWRTVASILYRIKSIPPPGTNTKQDSPFGKLATHVSVSNCINKIMGWKWPKASPCDLVQMQLKNILRETEMARKPMAVAMQERLAIEAPPQIDEVKPMQIESKPPVRALKSGKDSKDDGDHDMKPEEATCSFHLGTLTGSTICNRARVPGSIWCALHVSCNQLTKDCRWICVNDANPIFVCSVHNKAPAPAKRKRDDATTEEKSTAPQASPVKKLHPEKKYVQVLDENDPTILLASHEVDSASWDTMAVHDEQSQELGESLAVEINAQSMAEFKLTTQTWEAYKFCLTPIAFDKNTRVPAERIAAYQKGIKTFDGLARVYRSRYIQRKAEEDLARACDTPLQPEKTRATHLMHLVCEKCKAPAGADTHIGEGGQRPKTILCKECKHAAWLEKEKAAAEEAKRKADEAKRLADEAKRKADEAKRAEDEKEAKRKKDEEIAAEAKRKADEAKRLAEETKRKADEAEAKRKADEAKRLADEAEAKRKADEETKRIADEVERERKRLEEVKRKADEQAAIEAQRIINDRIAKEQKQAELDALAREADAARKRKEKEEAEAVEVDYGDGTDDEIPPTPQHPSSSPRREIAISDAQAAEQGSQDRVPMSMDDSSPKSGAEDSDTEDGQIEVVSEGSIPRRNNPKDQKKIADTVAKGEQQKREREERRGRRSAQKNNNKDKDGDVKMSPAKERLEAYHAQLRKPTDADGDATMSPKTQKLVDDLTKHIPMAPTPSIRSRAAANLKAKQQQQQSNGSGSGSYGTSPVKALHIPTTTTTIKVTTGPPQAPRSRLNRNKPVALPNSRGTLGDAMQRSVRDDSKDSARVYPV